MKSLVFLIAIFATATAQASDFGYPTERRFVDPFWNDFPVEVVNAVHQTLGPEALLTESEVADLAEEPKMCTWWLWKSDTCDLVWMNDQNTALVATYITHHTADCPLGEIPYVAVGVVCGGTMRISWIRPLVPTLGETPTFITVPCAEVPWQSCHGYPFENGLIHECREPGTGGGC